MQPIDKVDVSYQENNSDRYNIFALNSDSTSNVTAYHILGYDDANWLNTVTTHLATHLNMYGITSVNRMNQQFPNGLIGSAFEDLYTSLKTDGVVVLDINSDNYRSYLDGTFAIKVPLNSSYTGMTSGLTETTLYSSYIWDPTALKLSKGSFCAGTKLDAQRDESNSFYTDTLLGIGNPKVDGINPSPSRVPGRSMDVFSSRISFLMTDDVYYTFTGGTGSSVSWSYNFGVDNQFSVGRRPIMTDFNNTMYSGYYDRVQGMVDVNAGLVFLWGEVAKAFDWTQFTGDMYTTGATPNASGTTIMDTTDWDYQVGVKISLIVTPEIYKTSSNPSLIGQTNCDTVFNRVCFYDKNGGLMAQAVLNTPKELDGSYIPMEFFLPTAGVIGDTSDRVYPSPL